MNTKFAVALHCLVFISESPEPMTSETLAETLNTNPGYVRRVLAPLAKAGLISSASKGRGCALLKEPEEIQLAEVRAVVEPEARLLGMDLPRNQDTDVRLGSCERPVIEGLFDEMERAASAVLERRTLADLIADVKRNMEPPAPTQGSER